MGWSALWKKWVAGRERRLRAREAEARLLAVTERLVQDTDPVIRNIRGYERRLKEPVGRALAYIDSLVAIVPPPVALDPERWDKHPLSRALFVGREEMAAFFRESAELREFFRRRPEATEAFGILTAVRRERVVFGTAIEGEIVRRDVSQVAVEFADLKLVAPAASEEESRRELAFRTLKLFTVYALKRILEREALHAELTEQRRILEVKLKIQQSRLESLESDPEARHAGGAAPDPGSRLLDEIDRRLMELDPGGSNAAAHLEHLAEALGRPEELMTAQAFRLNLNWMGIKQTAADPEGAEALALAEVRIANLASRTAVLVRIGREAAARS